MTTIEYSYDVKGRKASRTDLRSSTSEYYIYDGDHIVAGVAATGNALAGLTGNVTVVTAEGTTHYRYDLAGNRTAKISNGVATTYTLSTGNRLSQTTTQSTNLLSIVGTMNEPIGTDDRWGTLSVSNLTTAEGTKPQVGGAKYVADLTGLEGASNTIVSAIRDRAGNMAYNTTHLYLPATEASSTTAYQYDEAGNLTERGEQSFTWDSRYRLTSATSEAGIVEYSYDLLNRRTARTADGTTEHYVYDGHHIVADVTTEGELLRTYTYGQGIDAIQSMSVYGAETNTYHYLRDHLNSVVGLVDESGSIVESYSYDAYGNTQVFNAEGEEIERSAIGNRYAFQGREIDWETGLYNFRARWYDPETGRWCSKDPIGIAGGLNLYEAFGNNGVNFVDPFGFMGNRPSRPGPGSADFRKYGESGVIIASVTVVVAEIKNIENDIMDELLSENPDEDLINELEKDLAELQEILEKITEASEKCLE